MPRPSTANPSTATVTASAGTVPPATQHVGVGHRASGREVEPPWVQSNYYLGEGGAWMISLWLVQGWGVLSRAGAD